MEKELLEIFKIANYLNANQDKVYAQITYSANDYKTLEIAIRSKKDFSFLDKCEVQLKENWKMKCNNIFKVLESYIPGGVYNE